MPARENKVFLPGKVFLFGEYSVLHSGPAILATHPPFFTLEASDTEPRSQKNPFPPASPAGQLWDSDRDFFSSYHFDFQDPYKGAGGFGRSSAEFGALFLFRAEKNQCGLSRASAAWEARDTFRNLTISEGAKPSGVDLLAQVVHRPRGKLLSVDPGQKTLQDLSGLPKDLALFLVHSGRKQPTHTHLASLNPLSAAALSTLDGITRAAERLLHGRESFGVDSLERAQSLGELLSAYGDSLASIGLAAESTSQDIKKIRKLTGVLGAKGCGALGVDVYAIAVYRSDTQRFLRELNAAGFERAFELQSYEWSRPW